MPLTQKHIHQPIQGCVMAQLNIFTNEPEQRRAMGNGTLSPGWVGV